MTKVERNKILMTIKFEQQESGLLIPEKELVPPKRKYRTLEIQDEERRKLAIEGLSLLWDAMNLTGWSPLREPIYSIYYQVYRFVGKMLLGEDCPEKEVFT